MLSSPRGFIYFLETLRYWRYGNMANSMSVTVSIHSSWMCMVTSPRMRKHCRMKRFTAVTTAVAYALSYSRSLRSATHTAWPMHAANVKKLRPSGGWRVTVVEPASSPRYTATTYDLYHSKCYVSTTEQECCFLRFGAVWSLQEYTCRRNVSLPSSWKKESAKEEKLWRHIPDESVLQSHCLENLKSYIALTGWAL
jgi:hypothetical protein